MKDVELVTEATRIFNRIFLRLSELSKRVEEIQDQHNYIIKRLPKDE